MTRLLIVKQFILLLFLISCDFSTGLNKKIIEAEELLNKQQYFAASKLYESILKSEINDDLKIKINYQLGDIYSIYLNNPKSAINKYKESLELSKDLLWQIKTLSRLADISFVNKVNLKEVYDYYYKLYNFIPKLEDSDFYLFRMGKTLALLENVSEAKKIFTRISQDQYNTYLKDSLYELGFLSYLEKDWLTAIKYWNKYLLYEKNKDAITRVKFLIANAYETNEDLKQAYNIYYSILKDYPNPSVIKSRLDSLYKRRVSRKR